MAVPTKKDWHIAPPIPPEANLALHEFPPVLRQLLYNRGYQDADSARAYLEPQIPSANQAFQLNGMVETVERVQWAIRKKQRIAVYGDYDADGVTATALLTGVFESMGADVIGYIPNRFDEGYGLNVEALDHLAQQGVGLVITVDCGIRSTAEVEHAQRLGLDVIISDHHHPGNELPAALAIINPKQPGDAYPDKDLAGVGLAYKLACALGYKDHASLLDLVALGTVADLAPLTGENRALVREGLRRLRQPDRQGIASLIGVSGLKPGRINADDIGYILGPRLNAAGRLESALAALELLRSKDIYQAASLAQKLENQNRERQQITREIQAKAEEIALQDYPQTYLLFAAHPDFNPGVVGLAASRLTELYYRPAIVAHSGETYTRASCRSIPEFHITQALDQCADLLEHHGGHAAAAGFTVKNKNLPELVERLHAIAASQLSSLELRPVLHADMEIPLSELKPELLHYLEMLQPTGRGNPQASFVSRNLRVMRSRLVGKEGSHLKLSVSDGRITYDAIAFRQGYWQDQLPERVDILYTYERDEYNSDRISLQLNVRDIKPAEQA